MQVALGARSLMISYEIFVLRVFIWQIALGESCFRCCFRGKLLGVKVAFGARSLMISYGIFSLVL